MYKNGLKRFFDFGVALSGLLFLSPVLLIVMGILIYANKGAGVFFLQAPPGKKKKNI